MGRGVAVPINPAVLAWALNEAGVGEGDLAEHCQVSEDVVAAWLDGSDQPNATQFSRVVTGLKRPRAVFFLPTPPKPSATLRAFRAAPGRAPNKPPPAAEVQALRTAERLQRIASWIRRQHGDPPQKQPDAGHRAPATVAAAAAELLDWGVEIQMAAASSSEVARTLRSRLEQRGLFVLQLPMSGDGSRGFALLDDFAPLIAVNSAYTMEARIFSFLHEFGHILRKRDSLCTQASDTPTERWCESFAASFLLPEETFRSYVSSKFGDRPVVSLEEVKTIANKFKVSLRAAAYRLQTIYPSSSGVYARVDEQADFKGAGGFTRDATTPAIRLREWGSAFPALLMDGEERGVVGRSDVLEYLNVSNSQLAEIRSRIQSSVDDT